MDKRMLALSAALLLAVATFAGTHALALDSDEASTSVAPSTSDAAFATAEGSGTTDLSASAHTDDAQATSDAADAEPGSALAPQSTIVAQGTFKSAPGVSWSLDSDGLLNIAGTGSPDIRDVEVPTTSNYQAPWFKYAAQITSVHMDSTVTPVCMRDWFDSCTNLATTNASEWNVSACTDMNAAFFDCSSLVSLDVSQWDTSKCADMQGMFQACQKLEVLDVSRWNTSSCENMESMFQGCWSLEVLDISKWNTSRCAKMSRLFAGCTKVSALAVSKWDLSSCESMIAMFEGCSKLLSLDVAEWNVSKCKYMDAAFSGCSALASPDVSKWETSSCEDMTRLFFGCSKIASLDLSNWDTSKCVRVNEMFNDCSSLWKVALGPKWSFKASGSETCPLPDAPTASPYTGMWQAAGTGDVSGADPKVTRPNGATYTSDEMVEQCNDKPVETYVWSHAPVTTYSVSFDANGGTGSMAGETFVAGHSKALSTNAFSRDGYTFSGWNTAADGTGDSYADAQEIFVSAATTLYAQWTKGPAGGSSGSTADTQQASGPAGSAADVQQAVSSGEAATAIPATGDGVQAPLLVALIAVGGGMVALGRTARGW